MKPGFSFCGYPVIPRQGDTSHGENYIPCGAIATPGCAFCEYHGRQPDPERIFPYLDGRLTAEQILARAAARERLANKRIVRIWLPLFTALSAIVALYQPVHTWLHAHLQLLAGVMIGSLLEAFMWTFVEWAEWRELRREGKQ